MYSTSYSLQFKFSLSDYMKLTAKFVLHWLQRWVVAFHKEAIYSQVTTNNGLERQHLELKYRYLVNYSSGSLTDLVRTIVQKFVPDSKRKYVYLVTVNVPTWPSVLWRCWLGGRKGIRPVKKLCGGYWHGYLSGERCSLAQAQLMPLSLASVKSRLVLPFWYRLTRVVPEKGLLNGCSSSSSS